MKKNLIATAFISLLGLSISILSAQQTSNGANSNSPLNRSNVTSKNVSKTEVISSADTASTDTAINVETIEAALVNAVNLGKSSNNLSSVMIIQKKDPINQQNLGRDIPFLTQSLTNVITTSDAGNGVGYSGIRVRGSAR